MKRKSWLNTFQVRLEDLREQFFNSSDIPDQAFWEAVRLRREQSIFEDLGFKPEDLEGCSVLDVGAGDRSLERALARNNVKADIISIDINKRVVNQEDLPSDNAFVLDIYDGVPFIPDESMDLIVMRATPTTPNKEVLREVVRILKEGGEFRSAPDPLQGLKYSVLYNRILQEGGFVALTRNERKEAKRLELDENKLPNIETKDGLLFWAEIESSLSLDDQRDLSLETFNLFKKEMENDTVSMQFEEIEQTKEELYSIGIKTRLIIKKLSQEV